MRLSRRGMLATGIGGALQLGTAPARATGGHPIVQRELDHIRETQHSPGLAVAVVRHGQPAALYVSGRASIGLDVPVSSRTLFHLGSVGKHITAVAALRLVHAGKLSLDAPIGRYAPRLPATLADRPVRTLLDHSSGFPDYGPSVEWDRPFDRDIFYRRIRDFPIEFPAGESWNYSNAAYVLLGYVIEDLAGKAYARIVGEDLFARAALVDSRVDDAQLPIAARAEPYDWANDRHVHATRMSSTVSSVAAGGVLMSMRDVAPWVRTLHGGALLPPDLLAAMVRPVRLSTGRAIPYGLGWMLDTMPGGEPFYYHGGSVPGFRTLHIHLPHHGLSVMAVTNADTLAASIAGWRIAERHAPGSTPLALPILADTAPATTAQARAILTRSTAPDPAYFAPEITCHLAAGRDAVLPRLAAGQAAALRDFALVQADRLADGTHRRRYRACFADHDRHIAVHHLADGRIYCMRMQ